MELGRRDVWSVVHAERRALIGDLQELSPHQWARPSLCDGWSVQDVVAHLVDSARTTRVGFVIGLARARFDFDRQNAAGVAREVGSTPVETLARLRSVAERTSTPPALVSRIVEEVVHGEDIRRPLGLWRDYPSDAVEAALRLQARTPVAFGGAKQRVAPLRLNATDAEVVIGDGAEVSGPLLSLLLAVSGRSAALDDLRGPGVAALSRGAR